MYRCIIFTRLYPMLDMAHDQYRGFDKATQTSVGECVTPESAMYKACKEITYTKDGNGETVNLGSRLTYSPATGRVYVDGTCCGTVFKAEKVHRSLFEERSTP